MRWPGGAEEEAQEGRGAQELQQEDAVVLGGPRGHKEGEDAAGTVRGL